MTKKEVLEKYKGRYWHELTPEERNELFEWSVTYGDLIENIRQPDWCLYHEALRGNFGCWSLLEFPEKISKDWCKTCDTCKI